MYGSDMTTLTVSNEEINVIMLLCHLKNLVY